jgi:acyl-CoA synthetase (AMP-forming)/AMP-acid ligase II
MGGTVVLMPSGALDIGHLLGLIENIIFRDSRVAEAAVIGIEDEKWGEVGCALIVPKEGMTISTDELEGLCKKELAGYKMPVKFVIRDQPLPKTASGKIKKYVLVEEARKG